MNFVLNLIGDLFNIKQSIQFTILCTPIIEHKNYNTSMKCIHRNVYIGTDTLLVVRSTIEV